MGDTDRIFGKMFLEKIISIRNYRKLKIEICFGLVPRICGSYFLQDERCMHLNINTLHFYEQQFRNECLLRVKANVMEVSILFVYLFTYLL